MKRARIAVLASGGGSNLQALIDYLRERGEERGGDIVLVASDRADAGALARAERAGITTALVQSRRSPYEELLDSLLLRHRIDLVVLAGYLQLIPATVTNRYAGRVVNVHPAPLPDFGGAGMYGARAHRAVLAAGVALSGPTVHFVDEHYDHGATIAYWPVPVLTGDDDHALAERVLRAEHVLFPRIVDAIALGHVTPATLAAPILLPPLDPSLDAASLGALADDALNRYNTAHSP